MEPCLEIAACKETGPEGGDCMMMISTMIPEGDGSAKLAVDICCVVDVSGSMGGPATYEVDGVAKDDGLSILDIVKHAVKTVMHTLKDEDRLALVAFDDKAETVLPLTNMTEEGRVAAVAALDQLQPKGQTNLWDGLRAGMEALKAPAGESRSQKSILLLTDGLPTVSPPFGHLRELKVYKEACPEFLFQINTFGFGYSLDSELLLELAVEGNGTYAFIPDALIVGTSFVNTVANVLSTPTQNAKLILTTIGGTQFAETAIPGDHEVTGSDAERVVHLGPLQAGQPREVVVPLRLSPGAEPFLRVELVFSSSDGQEFRTSLEVADRKASPKALAASMREQAVTVGYSALRNASSGKGKAAQTSVQALVASLEEDTSGLLSGLKADVAGRMTKAMKGKERFNRWGKHYLRSLMRAHQLQVCTNFMDPGLQAYGGSLFKQLRDHGDSVFLSLPPPRPSRAPPAPPVPEASRPSSAASAPRPSAGQSSPPEAPPMQTYYAGAGGG
eukprot:TRINITY_DN25857_c0_g1_i1.p1 TRINITY_DN25857_c0_g1~~TRINITY_DN25857_c0_g1_i1.p1  ORF type:complete len:502 (-),score=112.80 TRINITY_DN25857_c0_g1_i1:124-1629(-)